jgi:Fe-S-cluster containining protein
MACVYLDEQGRCAIYEKRPMGCRKFECDRMSSAKRDMRLKDDRSRYVWKSSGMNGESEGGRGR